MPGDFIYNLTHDAFTLIRLLMTIFTLFYFFFSLIVIRQVFFMADTVKTEGDIILKMISLFHSLLALGITIIFIMLL